MQRLIASGHDLSLISDYTLPQIEAYLCAVDHEDRARNRVALVVARAAQADSKHFKKILKEFS